MDESYKPMTREFFRAAIDKMLKEPIFIEPHMEFFKCRDESCRTFGEKMFGMKMKCPKCDGDIWDLKSILKESRPEEGK